MLAVSFLASLSTGVFWNGISFIAKHTYAFDQPRNLMLYAAMGIVYTIGAFQAGRLTRLLDRWVTTRTLLLLLVAVQSLLCLGPILVEREWAFWLAATGPMVTSSLMWPIVESYLTAGRHGATMRSAIGWFNLVWMTAVTLPLIGMAPILENHGAWAIGGLAIANTFVLIPAMRFAPRPAAHDAVSADAHVSVEYPLLLRSARILLPMSYMLNSAMVPILPYRFETLGVAIAWETPATATWMIVRVLALIVMMRLAFWHGKWGALLLGAVCMTGGFALVVLAPTVAVMLLGFALLGAGLGVVYYAALYYAMAVGRAEVDAGGTHEGLIGAGYAIGPIAGLAGTGLGGGAAIVGSVWLLLAVGAVPAYGPYVTARARRRAG